MLKIDGLTRKFGNKTAVDNLSLEIATGSFVGVIGRSGAGKSTLLRMINRLETVTSGSIIYDGVDVATLNGKALRAWRAQCAMVFQQFNLVNRMDVLTNVLMGRLYRIPTSRALLRLWREDDKVQALCALEQFDIAALAVQTAGSLSGGQQQRVAIARALMQEPKIILADEPIASLDPRNSKIVMDCLLRLNRHFGITVICNLHSVELARSYCDHLIGMAQGRLVFQGRPEQLTDSAVRDLYGLEADTVVESEPGFDLGIGAGKLMGGAVNATA